MISWWYIAGNGVLVAFALVLGYLVGYIDGKGMR